MVSTIFFFDKELLSKKKTHITNTRPRKQSNIVARPTHRKSTQSLPIFNVENNEHQDTHQDTQQNTHQNTLTFFLST